MSDHYFVDVCRVFSSQYRELIAETGPYSIDDAVVVFSSMDEDMGDEFIVSMRRASYEKECKKSN